MLSMTWQITLPMDEIVRLCVSMLFSSGLFIHTQIKLVTNEMQGQQDIPRQGRDSLERKVEILDSQISTTPPKTWQSKE